MLADILLAVVLFLGSIWLACFIPGKPPEWGADDDQDWDKAIK